MCDSSSSSSEDPGTYESLKRELIRKEGTVLMHCIRSGKYEIEGYDITMYEVLCLEMWYRESYPAISGVNVRIGVKQAYWLESKVPTVTVQLYFRSSLMTDIVNRVIYGRKMRESYISRNVQANNAPLSPLGAVSLVEEEKVSSSSSTYSSEEEDSTHELLHITLDD